jgi:hypothetical protein
MAYLGANYGAVPVSTQVDVPNALANSYLLQQRQQAMQDQNALSQAVPLLQSDPQNAFATAAKTSPKAAMELLPVIQQMDKANRDKAADRSEALGRLLYSLKTQYKDPMVRKAVALSQAPALAAHDITPEQLQSADYSDAGVDLGIANVTSVKDMIAQSNNERDFSQKQDEFGEKKLTDAEAARHNLATEGLTARGQDLTNQRAADGATAWQVLTDPKAGIQYRYNARTGQATALDGSTPYSPGGAQKMASGMARSPATLAASMYLQEHPGATAEELTQFSANYNRTNKSVSAFGTGKQGDLLRSFNVGISHLNTLGGLVGALGNGDAQAINRFGNAYSQQAGVPAPTNFDAAKAIVGDEIIKAIVGGGGALADRENAQKEINRANSPQQLMGVIQTYKDLMAGQLRGLKKQYGDNTGRQDFDTHLSPEALAELHPDSNGAPAPAPAPASGWSNFKVHN